MEHARQDRAPALMLVGLAAGVLAGFLEFHRVLPWGASLTCALGCGTVAGVVGFRRRLSGSRALVWALLPPFGIFLHHLFC